MAGILEFDSARFAGPRKSPEPCNTLTPREREVMGLAHLTYREIGAELGISEETVRCHLSRIRLKLGAESTRAAVILWEREIAAMRIERAA